LGGVSRGSERKPSQPITFTGKENQPVPGEGEKRRYGVEASRGEGNEAEQEREWLRIEI